MFRLLIRRFGLCPIAIVLAFGCGRHSSQGPAQPEPAAGQSPPAFDADRHQTPQPVEEQAAGVGSASAEEVSRAYLPPGLEELAPNRAGFPERRSLGDLLRIPDSPATWLRNLPPTEVDAEAAAAAGIRKLSGKHLTLFTDLASDDEVDRLPVVFDQAFPQWCEYFGLDAIEQDDWKVTGFLMNDKQRFVQTGLLPDELPPFEHGYSRNLDLWLYEQPSPYYRRHLLLHEGTHSFMNTLLGSCGPPWYMEGIAELLATHRWHDGRLTLDWIPTSREEVPMWGRIRVIKDACADGKAIPLADVIRYSVHAYHETEPYAWCWAAACLLDHHPAYRDRFRQLPRLVRDPSFSKRFGELIGDDWDTLAEQWNVFIANLEYGHDVVKTALDFTPGKPLPDSGATVNVAADRGWQNSGLQLAAGGTYQFHARGRYQVADQPQIWWCEPGGVSIRYYRKLPLGILLGAVRPDQPTGDGRRPLIHAELIGLAATLTPQETGTLYLRINDSAGELDDNAGSLLVDVRPVGQAVPDRQPVGP